MRESGEEPATNLRRSLVLPIGASGARLRLRQVHTASDCQRSASHFSRSSRESRRVSSMTYLVGIFYPQNPLSAEFPREQVVVEGRPESSQVQIARRRWCKPEFRRSRFSGRRRF